MRGGFFWCWNDLWIGAFYDRRKRRLYLGFMGVGIWIERYHERPAGAKLFVCEECRMERWISVPGGFVKTASRKAGWGESPSWGDRDRILAICPYCRNGEGRMFP